MTRNNFEGLGHLVSVIAVNVLMKYKPMSIMHINFFRPTFDRCFIWVINFSFLIRDLYFLLYFYTDNVDIKLNCKKLFYCVKMIKLPSEMLVRWVIRWFLFCYTHIFILWKKWMYKFEYSNFKNFKFFYGLFTAINTYHRSYEW